MAWLGSTSIIGFAAEFLLIPFVVLLVRWCAATHTALAVRMLATDGTP
jgi:hypothetical protein